MASPDELDRSSTPGPRPRALAVIGLVAGLAGFLFALLPVVAGSRGLSGGYVAYLSMLGVLSITVILVVLGALIALLRRRASGIALVLSASVFLTGHLIGYLLSQQLRVYY